MSLTNVDFKNYNCEKKGKMIRKLAPDEIIPSRRRNMLIVVGKI